jgi:hypothetical protein
MNVIGGRQTQEELRTAMTLTLNNSMSTSEMQARISQIPRYLNANLTIQFSDGTYTPEDGRTLHFSGFCGNGTVTIQGNPSESGLHTNQAVIFTLGVTHATTCLQLSACSCPVIVKNIRFNRSAATLLYYASIAASLGNYDVSISGCCFDSQNQSCRGMFPYFSNIRFYDNYSGAHQVMMYIYACSNVLAWNNDDISAGNRPSYAYVTDFASLGYYGTAPSCVTAVVSTVNGGRTWT